VNVTNICLFECHGIRRTDLNRAKSRTFSSTTGQPDLSDSASSIGPANPIDQSQNHSQREWVLDGQRPETEKVLPICQCMRPGIRKSKAKAEGIFNQ
jgi:hypothetical protein